jgi:hypothetical protein
VAAVTGVITGCAICYHLAVIRHMHRLIIALLLLTALVPFADARGRSSGSRSRASRTASSRSLRSKVRSSRRSSTRCTSCARDSHGRIARSSTAKHQFQKSHPCPANGKTTGACPGYLIDHVVPLKRGGADASGNMQWQTKAAAKAKDKVE